MPLKVSVPTPDGGTDWKSQFRNWEATGYFPEKSNFFRMKLQTTPTCCSCTLPGSGTILVPEDRGVLPLPLLSGKGNQELSLQSNCVVLPGSQRLLPEPRQSGPWPALLHYLPACVSITVVSHVWFCFLPTPSRLLPGLCLLPVALLPSRGSPLRVLQCSPISRVPSSFLRSLQIFLTCSNRATGLADPLTTPPPHRPAVSSRPKAESIAFRDLPSEQTFGRHPGCLCVPHLPNPMATICLFLSLFFPVHVTSHRCSPLGLPQQAPSWSSSLTLYDLAAQ